MSQLSVKLGFWSAFLSAIAFIVFTICFVAIAMISPLFIWTDLSAYVTYVNDNSQFFQHSARLAMLLFGPLFIVLLNNIYDYADDDKKIMEWHILYSWGYRLRIWDNLTAVSFYKFWHGRSGNNHNNSIVYFIQAVREIISFRRLIFSKQGGCTRQAVASSCLKLSVW